jgi:hypothetical protein
MYSDLAKGSGFAHECPLAFLFNTDSRVDQGGLYVVDILHMVTFAFLSFQLNQLV